jgi:hypothetical protein
MATRKNTTPPKNFTGLLDDVQAPGLNEQDAASTKPEKGPLLTFHIDKDLKPMLDRVVFWSGKNGSQRLTINQALRALLEGDPTAQKPMPGE